ncbi:MAG: hypothetical protein WBP09_02805 [Propionicimonas sp.]
MFAALRRSSVHRGTREASLKQAISPQSVSPGVEAGERIEIGAESVVVVTEPDQWEWEVVVHQGTMVDFRVHGNGRKIDASALNHVPLADLARMATEYVARAEQLWKAGDARTRIMRPMPDLGSEEVQALTDEDLATAWKVLGPRDWGGVPRRKALAAQFGVTPWAIDKRVKRARERGLIPKATTGRGNSKEEDE